jgi:transcriptional regulator with XRE-family HTH domain
MAQGTRARGDRRRLVGRILKQLRLEAGLRQADVATGMGVPQSVVSKIESGERTADAVEVLEICRVLGLTMNEFTRRLESMLNAKHGR